MPSEVIVALAKRSEKAGLAKQEEVNELKVVSFFFPPFLLPCSGKGGEIRREKGRPPVNRKGGSPCLSTLPTNDTKNQGLQLRCTSVVGGRRERHGLQIPKGNELARD